MTSSNQEMSPFSLPSPPLLHPSLGVSLPELWEGTTEAPAPCLWMRSFYAYPSPGDSRWAQRRQDIYQGHTMGSWDTAKLLAQTPVWQQTSPSMEGRAPRKEGERKGSQWPPEHRRTRRGGCQHSQDLPRVSWVYVLQSSASDFLGSMGMITNPGLVSPLREAVEGVDVSAAAPLVVSGVQGHAAAKLPPLLSHLQHLTWGTDTAQPESWPAWTEGLCSLPPFIAVASSI